VALVALDAAGVPVAVEGHAATGWFPRRPWHRDALVVGAARGSGTQFRAAPTDGFRAGTHKGGASSFDVSDRAWMSGTDGRCAGRVFRRRARRWRMPRVRGRASRRARFPSDRGGPLRP
jgi:hypothetical protein